VDARSSPATTVRSPALSRAEPDSCGVRRHDLHFTRIRRWPRRTERFPGGGEVPGRRDRADPVDAGAPSPKMTCWPFPLPADRFVAENGTFFVPWRRAGDAVPARSAPAPTTERAGGRAPADSSSGWDGRTVAGRGEAGVAPGGSAAAVRDFPPRMAQTTPMKADSCKVQGTTPLSTGRLDGPPRQTATGHAPSSTAASCRRTPHGERDGVSARGSRRR
jgi:hypothetical protein